MRRTNFYPVIILAAAVLFITDCMTAEKSKAFRESPIALVSVVSNMDINWKDEKPVDPNVISRSTRRAMEEDPDKGFMTKADTIIDDVEALIMSSLASSTNIMPRENVLRSRSYNEARINSHQEKGGMAKPEGYRFVNFRDKKFFSGFNAETGTGKFLFITLDLTKVMSAGFSKIGNYRAAIIMSVMIIDERGRTQFNKKYEVFGRDQSKVSVGIYSQTELRQMLLSAVSDACYNFLDDITF